MYICTYMYTNIKIHIYMYMQTLTHICTIHIYIHAPGLAAYYGVASVSRINQIVGLFCKRALQKRRYSAKDNCNFLIPLTIATLYLYVQIYTCTKVPYKCAHVYMYKGIMYPLYMYKDKYTNLTKYATYTKLSMCKSIHVYRIHVDMNMLV